MNKSERKKYVQQIKNNKNGIKRWHRDNKQLWNRSFNEYSKKFIKEYNTEDLRYLEMLDRMLYFITHYYDGILIYRQYVDYDDVDSIIKGPIQEYVESQSNIMDYNILSKLANDTRYDIMFDAELVSEFGTY